MARHAVSGILATVICMACNSMAVAQEAPQPPPVRYSGPPVVIPFDDPDRLVVIVDGPYTLMHEDDDMVVFLANGSFRPHRNDDDILWVTTFWSFKHLEDGVSHIAMRTQIHCSYQRALTTTMVAFGPDGSFLGRHEPREQWQTIDPDSPFYESEAIACDGAAPRGRVLPGTPVDIANSFRR